MTWEPLWERSIPTLADLETVVRDLDGLLTERTVILLEGDLGAGKTETVKTFARLRGLREVASPSFAVHLRYEADDGRTVDHLDLYRIENDDDLESVGFWDLFSARQGIIFIEWADRLEVSALPRDWRLLRLRLHYDESTGARRAALSMAPPNRKGF